jgi:hypothetical protein
MNLKVTVGDTLKVNIKNGKPMKYKTSSKMSARAPSAGYFRKRAGLGLEKNPLNFID